MHECYLAIDIGASGGRHIMGTLDGEKLVLREIYRFENAMTTDGERLVWDTERIFSEILTGLKKCKEAEIIPKCVGLDIWGVDYVFLDQELKRIGAAYAYRDHWTDGSPQALDAFISPADLYRRTGMQRMQFNSIYQLMARLENMPREAARAKHFLMLPDYFNFLLCGEILNEYTIASTSGLLDVSTKNWDRELISLIGVDPEIFGSLSMPGMYSGTLRKEIASEVGFSADVVITASHDTASAVMALPYVSGDPIYISSGTWSLFGCETMTPIVTEQSRALNFTNEGGYGGRFRYLKNIMGLWMIQSVRRELAADLGYDAICEMAETSDIATRIDADDVRFLAPSSMTESIQDFARERGERVPKGVAEIAAVVYQSLATCYGKTAEELASLTGRAFTDIHIVGGGAKADYLNRLTSKAARLPVHTGPSEATAIGNILCQMLANGVFRDLSEARVCVANSFEIKNYIGGKDVWKS